VSKAVRSGNPLVSLVSGAAAKFLAVTWLVAGCADAPTHTDREQTRKESALIVIQSYERGLAAVRAANPDVKLSLRQDAALPAESVLLVEYPAPTGNPAGRDVWCNAENVDWTKGHAISFQVKPDHAIRLSVSFLDRNRVAYTSWTQLQAGVWQPVRIPFDQIRPNPYFQPPGANTGAPIDVSEVKGIGFAPQDQSAGRLAISRFVVVE
jgi:hypothetical protein